MEAQYEVDPGGGYAFIEEAPMVGERAGLRERASSGSSTRCRPAIRTSLGGGGGGGRSGGGDGDRGLNESSSSSSSSDDKTFGYHSSWPARSGWASGRDPELGESTPSGYVAQARRSTKSPGTGRRVPHQGEKANAPTFYFWSIVNVALGAHLHKEAHDT